MQDVIFSQLSFIDEDFVFFRARFDGVKLSKIPTTCEKTAFLKEVNEYRRQLRKATSWKELQDVFSDFEGEIANCLTELIEEYGFVRKSVNLSKDQALNQSSIFRLFVRFNDIQDGYPNGYYIPILNVDLRKERMEQALHGYISTLQYVWHRFVGAVTYYGTVLSNLHESQKWSESFEMGKALPKKEDRIDLDRFFGDLGDELIQPRKEETGLSVIDDCVLLDKSAQQQTTNYLDRSGDNTELNQEEAFDYQLLWYQAEFIRDSNIFNGVPAFISLLSGAVNLKRRFADGEKTYACKFTHPVKPGNDYTYGVLVEARGSTGLGDYSGWVMFYDCCGDYSGFAGSEHRQAEQLIQECQSKDLLELREMELEKDEFQELIAERTVGERSSELNRQLDLESQRNHLQSKTRKARGLLVELISHYYLSRQGHQADELDWNIPLETGELDILLKRGAETRCIECKYDPSNQDWNHEIEKLEQKVEEISSENDASGEFWFWHEPTPEAIDKIERHGFEFKVVSDLVSRAQEFRGKDLEHLMFVLEKSSRDSQDSEEDSRPMWGM